MITRNKKFLLMMITSAMVTSPVWAADQATGYDANPGQTVEKKVSASDMTAKDEGKPMALNTVVTSASTPETEAVMKNAKSGLTGYETDEELAAIAKGQNPEDVRKPAEKEQVEKIEQAEQERKNQVAKSVISGNTGYEQGTVGTAESAKEEGLPGASVPYMAGLGDVQIDTTVPKYPMAVLEAGQESTMPYGNAVTDESIAPYVNKVTTAVNVGPVPDPAIEAYLLPKLAMRVGDMVSADYVRHDVNIIGSTGLFSTVQPAFTNVPEGVALNYAVQLNPVINGVEITGNKVYKTDALQQMIQFVPGSPLNSTIISKDVANINNLYAKDGYMYSHVSNATLDSKGILHIGITECHLEDVVVRGNTKTKTRVVTREVRMKKGDVFNRAAASRSVERIYNTGYFEDINVRMLPGKKNPNDVIMEIDVVESKTGQISIGGGYSQSNGLVGLLGLSESNFRGTGDKVAINWEFGGETDSNHNYTFSYTHPWLNDHGDSIGFSLFNRDYDYEDYDEKGNSVADYDRVTTGFNFTYGRVRSEYVSDYVTLETKKTKYDDWNSGFDYTKDGQWRNGKEYDFKKIHYLDKNFGRTNSLTWSHVFDNRDNVYDPTRGKRISYTAAIAGHGLGGDFDYYKLTFENRLYYKVGRKHVIALRFMGGYANGDMPYYDLFTLGGADNLRGYEDDEFRGNKMYAATVEYRYPIAKKIQGVFFVDAGSAWDGTGNIPWYQNDDSIHVSTGLGFRITTPIGPIRLDYGVGDDGGKFHFSFGGKF